jgi:hypothetical protein
MTRCSHHEPSHDGTVYRCDREATEPGGVCAGHVWRLGHSLSRIDWTCPHHGPFTGEHTPCCLHEAAREAAKGTR